MVMDRRQIDKVMKYVREEHVEQDRRRIRAGIKGVPVGQQQVDDDTYRAWFELTVAERGEAWVRALGRIPEGRTLVRRYERIVGEEF